MTRPGGMPNLPSGLRAAITGLAIVALGGCTMPPLSSPTPRPSPTVGPTASPTIVPPSVSPTPSPIPTPDLAAIPAFAAGDIVSALIDGLRVRQRPGTNAPIATGLLPIGSEMEVVMGPLPVDGLGWYLVVDVDPGEPSFEEGWVAAGYEPDPFLRATGRRADEASYVLSMAGQGDAEQGPITIAEEVDHAIRWIARDPEGVRCAFGVALASPSGDPVSTIRATVGAGIDRGTLQPQTFAALGVRGTAFVSVTSDCAWALVILRVPDPEPSVEPSPS